MKTDCEHATIIDDSGDEDIIIIPKTTAKPRIKQQPLNKFYVEDSNIFEIGVDEVGRGPLEEFIQQRSFYLKMIVLIIHL